MPGWLPSTRRALALGTAVGLTAALAVEAATIYGGRNWHALVPGRAYRSAQLTPSQLRDAVERYGIRTVINLRGCSPGLDWYTDESRATHDLDISQEDITLSANRLPPPAEIRRLVEVLDGTEYPVLLHCRQGVDRTGLASAVVLLLRADVTLAEARRQLSLRYGHVPLGQTRCMGEFFDLYEDWLREQGRPHSREAFRAWACEDYCPAHGRGRLEWVEPPGRLRAGAPAALTVRATNTSVRPWRLVPGTEAGVHVRYLLFDDRWQMVQVGRAGQFEATVAPGERIDLTLALTTLSRPGRYHLLADLHDRNHCAFSQLGGEPLEMDIQVDSP